LASPRAELDGLVRRVQACEACDGVRFSHVLGAGNGPATARVMFVGEAPGRLGAGRSGVPFRGDESGRRFEAFLDLAGLAREEVFVTNAVLCNPVDAQGRNRAPRIAEVKRCLGFLREQVLAVDPEVVVALGGVSLAALAHIEPHGAGLRSGCGRLIEWWGRTLVPLYHPGRRAIVHRADALQQDDWRKLGAYLGQRLLAGSGSVIANDRPRPLSGAAGVRQATK
jgi:uracil-DNA glycosylase family 4